MSKYTTEVRFICEQKSGLTESKGYSDVGHIIDEAWDKIFKSNEWDIYDEAYRPVLCKKILKHFYTREIGAETVGLWEMWLNQRMSEIMPYYNQLYKSAMLEYNPLYDTDMYTEGNKKDTGSETHNENVSKDNTRTDNLSALQTNNLHTVNNGGSNHNDTSYDLYSDTPQGALNGVEREEYLTNARKVRNSGSETHNDDTGSTGTIKVDNTGTQKNNGKEDKNGNKNFNNTGTYAEHVFGKRGSISYSKMIMEFRDAMVNIDLMIIEELNDLFFNLW